ncbi:hypothetical protein BS47DRAFT_1348502 [Hydnum rufescens UP504]|uniref:Uncharacterized protein n=1 Tax=Hydnum rufescens UP504 TaxID=1448309 RepID=A0A9P6DSW4_9AGAM|nr:hypothetical protein BS47DRAFT_1348502 [Hydnum rufescens UP504]
MSSPQGVRDGPFIKFEGWDIPHHDVGQYFKDLTGDAKINALKAATLAYGSHFFAFNNDGWGKYWKQFRTQQFVREPNRTIYIRVEFPGWVFHPGLDSPGNDIANVGANSPPAIIDKINNLANPYEVVAFNTNGWIKKATGPTSSNLGPLDGYYTKAQ